MTVPPNVKALPADRYPMLSKARRLTAVAVGIAVGVAVLSAVIQGWAPVGDQALIELRVRDVPAHVPLVGPWSRFGWNHPGPAQFYFLSVFYWLGAHSSAMLLVGTVFLHLLFGLFAWWSAKRISPLVGALVACGALATLVTTAPTTIRDPWNPYVVTLGGLALCCAAWSLAERHRAGALALLPIGTFLVQAHVVTGPFVVAVMTVSVVLMVTTKGRPIPGKSIGQGLVVAFMMWVPVMVQQLTNDPGNITRMVTSSRSGEPLGYSRSLRVMSNALKLWPDVLDVRAVEQFLLPTTKWTFPFWAVVFVAVIALLVQRRDWVLLRAAGIGIAALIGSTVGTAMMTGGAFGYLALTRRSSVVFLLVVSAAGVLTHLPHMADRGLDVIYASAALLAVAIISLQFGAPNPMADRAPVMKHFADAIDGADLPRELGFEVVLTDLMPEQVTTGLMVELEHRGLRSGVRGMDYTHVGEHRASRRIKYLLKVDHLGVEDRLVAQGWTVLATSESFSRSDRLRLVELRDRSQSERPIPRADPLMGGFVPMDPDIKRILNGRFALILVGKPVS